MGGMGRLASALLEDSQTTEVEEGRPLQAAATPDGEAPVQDTVPDPWAEWDEWAALERELAYVGGPTGFDD